MEYRPVVRDKNKAGAAQTTARQTRPLRLVVVLLVALLGMTLSPARAQPEDQAETYRVTRVIRLQLTGEEALGLSQPGWDDAVMGGIYTETLTRLHKQAIQVEGTFVLRLVSAIAQLNPVSELQH